MAFGKPGRPPEDRLGRQREIFERVAPLILEHGAKGLSMTQAARAACLSVGGLYHYFPTKRDLVLHALRPEAFARICEDFERESADLAQADPEAFLEAFVDFVVRQAVFIRPAMHAALELGADTFFAAIEAGIQEGLDDFTEFLRAMAPGAADRDMTALARGFRRAFLGALLDRTMTPDELRAALWTMIEGEALGLRRRELQIA